MPGKCFGRVLFVVAILLPTTSMVDNASGEGAEEEATEENNTNVARQVIDAFNTDWFISLVS
jgi:hypothetical protein